MGDHDDTAGVRGASSPRRSAPEIASSLVEVDLAGLSDPGRVRRNNEDHFIATRFDRTMRLLSTNMPEGDVPQRYTETAYGMLVADGVGGAVAGEVASRTAIQSLIDLVVETPDWIMRYDEKLAVEVLHRMEDRFRKIRDILAERARADPTLLGMATTLTLACSLGSHLLIAHVGDSRAYLFHEGRLERLTRDQTLAQSLADAGAISPDEVAHHPSRHVLTGALATRGAFSHVELKRSHLADGDQILLCSDGLTEMVPEEGILPVLRQPGPASDACRALVDLALEAGGKDNVTVVLARYRIPEEARGAAA
jgi:serine/threonine protein phosphatase PrpC